MICIWRWRRSAATGRAPSSRAATPLPIVALPSLVSWICLPEARSITHRLRSRMKLTKPPFGEILGSVAKRTSRLMRNIAFFGSSLVSAYWNGAATYYRGIIRALHERGTFVIANCWDGGSARVLGSLGFPALATSSAASTRSWPRRTPAKTRIAFWLA